MPAAAFSLESAPAILANCLEQSQKTVSNHRKNINIAYKLFQQCASIVERGSTGKIKKLTGEIAFITTLKENGINRLLTLKRGIAEADRVVKFVCGFIAHTIEQQQARQGDAGENSENALTDAAASRLTSNILRHLLKGFSAKDKNVRFRSVQFVATLINGLGELDDSDYESLLKNLLERIKDKEAPVRVQAVYALAKLQNPEELNDGSLDYKRTQDDDDDGDLDPTPTKVLLDIMRYDSAAEVRRAAMFNLDLHPTTLPYILSRTRDIDPINRRVVFAQALAELPTMAVLSPEQRNVVIESGLRDREDSVKKSAAKLVGKWAGNMEGGLLEFVGLFDVINDTKVAEDAINSAIENRQDLAMALQFPDTYWTDLSPDSALLAKLYISYCKAVNDEARLEECLPVITALAFRIQDSFSLLVMLHDQMQTVISEARLSGEDAEFEGGLAEDFRSVCFVTRQLLEIALKADYGDEIGRRKMFTLIRDMVSDARLPAELVPTSMDVLLNLSSGERDFMRVIVEVVQNVREDAVASGRAASALPSEQEADDQEDDDDEDEDDLDMETATPEDIAAAYRRKMEKAAKKVQNQTLDPEKKDTYLRCLDLVRALLERVAGDNATLIGLVHELIVPSVKSKEPEIREQGLICLGLCGLLDKDMALDCFGLFIHQSQATEGELQIKIYQILFDVLLLYGVSFLEPKGYNAEVVIDFLLHALNVESQQVQAIAAVGIAKLMLSGMLTDKEVLKSLVLVYFAPETVDNLELRQCLSYFFPVYCYSLAANQKKMEEIFLPAFEILSGVYDELDDPSMMVSPVQLANQLLDWTDPRKAVAIEGLVVDQTIQAELAQELLKKIYKEQKKETRKLLCQLLNKLYLPDKLDDWSVKKLVMLVEQLENHRPLKDTVAKNALVKFSTNLNKQYEEGSRPMTEEEFRAFDQLHGVIEFLDEIKHENEERVDGSQAGNDSVATNSTATGSTRSGRKGSVAPRANTSTRKTPARRSRSISETPSIDSDEDSTPAPIAGSERRSARQSKPSARKEEEEEEDVDSEESEEEDDDGHSSDSGEEVGGGTLANTTGQPPAKNAQIQAKHKKSKSTPLPIPADSDDATDDTL